MLIWNDRLKGNPKDIDTWQKVLSVRGLLFNKLEYMEPWLKFCKMALETKDTEIA